ncbi:MAG TPA: gamma-glutamyltransferase [Micromonosporaceae bacterium]|nr:gamma-glutamyltransferase [Micromonosporaceae bacterium]
MTAGVAAGHPATAEVGLRTLAAGGSAADAAVAAMLACCVSESILTGIGGGGFATYYEAETATVTCLDFFCAMPGLDNDMKADPMVPIEVFFGDVPMSYMIGGASVAVPGVPAGAGEVHRRWGRLPWRQVVEPAITLAASGVTLPAPQARTLLAVAPALLPGDGAAIYAPGGRLLQGGDLLHHPGLDQTLTELAEQGPATFYTGRIGNLIVESVRESGGNLGPVDLATYRVADVPVVRARLAGRTVSARADFSSTIATIAALPTRLATMRRDRRAVALARALLSVGPQVSPQQQLGNTSNISVVDPAGNACVITLTLGIGSGVWPAGCGFTLNSMLGEGELMTHDLAPGQRVASNMCPLVVVDRHGDLELAAGSAGGSRIRTALISTLIGVLIDGRSCADAIAAPRFHPVAGEMDDTPAVIHAEPGYPEEELAALHKAGYVVNSWDHLSHYFGGVSAVGRAGAAGDPRRGGVGRTL